MAIGRDGYIRWEARLAIILHQAPGEGMGIVGGIVQHLDLEQLARIIDFGGFLKQALHHVTLVVNRKLHGHARKGFEAAGGLAGEALAMLHVPADHGVAMQTVAGQHHENAEVRDQHRPVEQRQVMNALKSVVGERVRDLPARTPIRLAASREDVGLLTIMVYRRGR